MITVNKAKQQELKSKVSHAMGFSQSKLHHKVLQGNWPSIIKRLQTPAGKKWVRQENPCGDMPLHLACYSGQAPPVVIRALILAYPPALAHKNHFGFVPLQLARVNYRTGHPFREEVLEFLEVYTSIHSTSNVEEQNEASTNQDIPEILQVSSSNLQPDNTYQTSSLCVICLENEADHVVIPCGHQCLCGDCAKKVLIGTKQKNNNHASSKPQHKCCPVGRCEIRAIVKVSAPSSISPLT